MTDLQGKVGLVTGASGGIGAAICRRLSDEGVAIAVGYGSGVQDAEVDVEMFDRTVAVNLRAPFLLAQPALAGMRERGFGRILFVSSAEMLPGDPEELARGIPVGRVGTPEEIADLAVATLRNG